MGDHMEILTDIPFKINPQDALKRMRFRRTDAYTNQIIEELIEKVTPIARPKVVFKASYVHNLTEDSVDLDGMTFTSRVLRKNLEHAGRVFPYVATCGRELESVEAPKDDLLATFCLDALKEMIMGSALGHLGKYISEKYAVSKKAYMNPGSLSDWPIEQQKQLFALFGDVEDLIGVKLKESFMMDPIKSVSGIYFPTEIDFKSCMLCPRADCSHRRARFDPEMAREYLG